MKDKFEKYWVSQKAILIRNGKVLILGSDSQPGCWDLPGGRIDIGEDREESFRREIKEELGIKDFKNLGVVDYDAWYNTSGNTTCGIINLIENNQDEIIISKEHTGLKWIKESELDSLTFVWRNKNGRIGLEKRAIKKVFKFYKYYQKISEI